MNVVKETSFGKLVLLGLLMIFVTLWLFPLCSGDETRAAGITLEMFLQEDWLVPRLNGKPFLEYPPMFCWVSAPFYWLWGASESVAKLPSAMSGFLTVLLVYALCRRLHFSEHQAFLSGAILLTCGYFLLECRKCRVDSLLTFFIVLSMYAFVSMREARGMSRLGFFALFVAGLSGGICTKGLFGLVMPGVYAGTFLLATDILQCGISWRDYREALLGALCSAVIASLWYLLIWRHGGNEMFHTAFWVNNLGRFSGGQGDHVEPVWYYLVRLPEFFLPWLPVLACALWMGIRRLRERERPVEQRVLPFLVLVPILLLSLSAAKRMVYLLPVYPFAAIVSGLYATALYRSLNGSLRRKLPAGLPRLLFVLLICILLTADCILAARFRRRESLGPLFAAAIEQELQGWQLFLVDPRERTEGASFFYLHRNLPVIESADAKPGAGQCFITSCVPDNANARRFNDRHYLLLGPEPSAAKNGN